MKYDEIGYIVELVGNHPGRFTPTDVIKELRLHCISVGRKDPGLAKARRAFAKAVRTARISIGSKGSYFCLQCSDRCYPNLAS